MLHALSGLCGISWRRFDQGKRSSPAGVIVDNASLQSDLLPRSARLSPEINLCCSSKKNCSKNFLLQFFLEESFAGDAGAHSLHVVFRLARIVLDDSVYPTDRRVCHERVRESLKMVDQNVGHVVRLGRGSHSGAGSRARPIRAGSHAGQL